MPSFQMQDKPPMLLTKNCGSKRTPCSPSSLRSQRILQTVMNGGSLRCFGHYRHAFLAQKRGSEIAHLLKAPPFRTVTYFILVLSLFSPGSRTSPAVSLISTSPDTGLAASIRPTKDPNQSVAASSKVCIWRVLWRTPVGHASRKLRAAGDKRSRVGGLAGTEGFDIMQRDDPVCTGIERPWQTSQNKGVSMKHVNLLRRNLVGVGETGSNR
jgi:hypothetical protein